MQRVIGWMAAGALLLMGVGLAQADGAPVRAATGTSPVAPATAPPRAALACVRRGATWVPHAVIMRRVMIGGRIRMISASRSSQPAPGLGRWDHVSAMMR